MCEHDHADDFTCAICQRHVPMRWQRHLNHAPIAPLCQSCERDYVPAKVHTGAFRDRRKIQQIGALSEALLSHASVQEWEARFEGAPL